MKRVIAAKKFTPYRKELGRASALGFTSLILDCEEDVLAIRNKLTSGLSQFIEMELPSAEDRTRLRKLLRSLKSTVKSELLAHIDSIIDEVR